MSQPSTVPSNEGSLDGIINIALKKFQQDLQIMLPCVVTKVDRQNNKVNVIPLIRVLLTDGTTQKRNEVFNIPIGNISTKKYIINVPIEVGDYGYIKTCDRDISLFKQSWNEAKPNTLRKQNFSDGVFYPDTINPTNWNIDNEDLNNLVIQYKDGSTKISMGENKITLKAETIESVSTNHIIKTTNLDIQAVQSNSTGTFKNNGVSIDSTHIHAQPNDSRGDTEADTTPPIN